MKLPYKGELQVCSMLFRPKMADGALPEVKLTVVGRALVTGRFKVDIEMEFN